MLARNHLLEYELLHSKTVLKRGNNINSNTNSKKLIKQSRSKPKLSQNSSRVLLDTLNSKSSKKLFNLSRKSTDSDEQFCYVNLNPKKESKSKNKNIIAMRKPKVYNTLNENNNSNNNLNKSNIMNDNNNNNSNVLKLTINEYNEEFENEELDEYQTVISQDVTPPPLYNLHTTRELAEFGKSTLQDVKNITNVLNHAQSVNSRLSGLGSPGGPIARQIKAPGPHNGHNPISKSDSFLNPNFDVGDEVIRLQIPYTMEQEEWNMPYGLPLSPPKFIRKKVDLDISLNSTLKSTLKSSQRPSSASIPNSIRKNSTIKRPTSAAPTLNKQINQSNNNSPINSSTNDKLKISITEDSINSLDIVGQNSKARSLKKLKHLTENYLSHKSKNISRPKSGGASKVNQGIIDSKAFLEKKKSITSHLYAPKLETDLALNFKESDNLLY
jgi:hypothetical protein